MDRQKIWELIQKELAKQDAKWGPDRILDPRTWITIIGEEYGEVCHASLEHDADNYLEELIDVAASAIAAVQSLFLEQGKPFDGRK